MSRRFTVIGDATLDVTVAPSRPMRMGGDAPAVIRLGPGGQGANVAVRLARRGAAVTLVAPVGSDATGRLLHEALVAENVRVAPVATARTAAVVALLDPRGERSMLSDRQVLPSAALAPSIADADWLHVSAYALLDSEEGDGLSNLLAERLDGARLSVAGGSIPPEPGLVDRFRGRLQRARPDLLVLSRDEAAALLGSTLLAREAARRLSGYAPVVVVTSSSQGSSAVIGAQLLDVPAYDTQGPMLDATGAGDAYLAALVLGLAGSDGWPPSTVLLGDAMRLGSLAGAETSRTLGAQAPIPAEAEVAPA
jgi:sugar/nucleoside kinase (ribokinase family)